MARTHATEEHVTFAMTSTIEKRFHAVFSVDPLRGYMTRPTEFSSVSEFSAGEYSRVKRLVW
jgi:hypothetical protein